MDGSVKNSDFDIIKDIEKINAIIFTVPFKYDGQENNNEDLLDKFLNGDEASSLSESNNPTNNAGNIDSVIINRTTTGATSSGATLTNNTSSAQIPWAATCNTDGTIGTTTVANMIDANFIRDLNAALSGNNSTITNN